MIERENQDGTQDETPKRFFDDLRERLEREENHRAWCSLDEIAETEAFRDMVRAEFPAAYEATGESRREFIKTMGASLALAGLGTACVRQPREEIVPYVEAPEFLVPGKPLMYATSVSRGGYGVGLVVETHQSRPTKADGNALHPASRGATGPIEQAEILELYEPSRGRTPLHLGLNSTWRELSAELSSRLTAHRRKLGAGLRILVGEHSSPTLAWQLEELTRKLPEARIHQWEALGRRNVRAGARRAFGRVLETRYALSEADVLAVFDADLFESMPGALTYAREFMKRRIPTGHEKSPGNRLYAVESTPTLAGTVADHRFRARASDIGPLIGKLAHIIGVPGAPAAPREASEEDAMLRALGRDLLSARGRSAVVVGDAHPAQLHALVHAINAHLGNVNRTVLYTEPVVREVGEGSTSIEALVDDMKGGRVETLLILGGNPAYDAPADLDFQGAMDRVAFRLFLGRYRNDTAFACHWYVPESHAFEAWGDTRAFDGTVSIHQPLVRPLYASKSSYELLAFVLGQPVAKEDSSTVQAHWRAQHGADGFDARWRRTLHDGVMAGTAFPRVNPTLRADAARVALRTPDPGIEITFRPDPSVWDGRFANNGWLQELPRPITKLTWGNAAHLSPRTAEALGVRDASVIEITHQGAALRIPALVVPGQADDSIALHLGYGQARTGGVGKDVGANAYVLRTTKALDILVGARVAATEVRAELAVTQSHHRMEGRELIRHATTAEYAKNGAFATAPDHTAPLSLYKDWDYSKGPQWGMSINLNTCFGCNACIVACQAENNIPVVGKNEVRIGREMHWIRIDRYYEGSLDEPQILQQPVSCMHCEKAPCELVCPVAATVHGPEGLNQMVYNRCVGTRYCSNNCPYKVRRFNFYLFADYETPSYKGMRNPDVTVRSRGVMEKCTYCVQRISAARIEAKKERRPIRDGEVVTACQAACPTDAISFGDILGDTVVANRKSSPLDYTLLTELRTQPRTSYLARVTNPNPALKEDARRE